MLQPLLWAVLLDRAQIVRELRVLLVHCVLCVLFRHRNKRWLQLPKHHVSHRTRG